MNFQYRAVNTDGGVVTGTIIAQDLRVAARNLKNQGLNVISLDAEIKKSAPAFRSARKSTPKDVTLFLHQLCVLLESEVPMAEAVESLSESLGHPILQRQCATISAALRGGTSFSQALSESGLQVPTYFHPLLKAGEATGHLAQSLRDGLDQWTYEQKTRKKLINSLTYPAILVVSGIAAVLLIFLMVVPKFVGILEKSKGKIPFLARIVLGTGKFFNENLLMVGLSVVGLALLVTFCLTNKIIRRRLKDFLGRLPLLREWLHEADIGNWAAMLATLLENRVNFVHALDLARHNVSLTSVQSRLTYATRAVRGGEGLAQALANAQVLDATGCNLIRVGEKSGRLPAMLRSLSSLCEEEVKNRTERLLLLIEPVAIILIGAVVGIIMAGIILAITSMNEVNF